MHFLHCVSWEVLFLSLLADGAQPMSGSSLEVALSVLGAVLNKICSGVALYVLGAARKQIFVGCGAPHLCLRRRFGQKHSRVAL